MDSSNLGPLAKSPPYIMPRALCLVLMLSFIMAPVSLYGSEAPKIYYETAVRSILKAHCFQCHGEEKELSGGLDLRLKRLIVKGGESGAAIVPGKGDESLLIDYITSGEMPPKEELKLDKQEITTITNWVMGGALTQDEETTIDPKPGDLLITTAERSHWSYQPILKPDIPLNNSPQFKSTNPIDAFIARKLNANKLAFSSEANRISIIRRASFDLLGLPPTPEEVDLFLKDRSPNAYDKLIDRLLASPHYGERWGRHWLDVAGYADSEGFNDIDMVRNDAWSYRDYVIRSFNEDVAWNQFLTEQIAGDELVNANNLNAYTLANSDKRALKNLIATGFLRLGPDGTGSDPMDPKVAQNKVITETLKIVSSAILGTTVGCAECHHHRFDPIPQDDFYRMRAIFAPVYNTENWLEPKNRRLEILSKEDNVKSGKIDAEAKKFDDEYKKIKNGVIQLVLKRVLDGIPEEKRDYGLKAYETPKEKRTPEQTKFVEEQFPMLGLLNPVTLPLFLARYEDGPKLQESYEKEDKKAAELRKLKPKPYYIRIAVEDPKKIPKTFLFTRGDISSPEGEPLAPAGLTLFSNSKQTEKLQHPKREKSSGRRLEYAQHLTNGKHPLVARVLVNRFWHHHFGRGLVESTGDFGKQGDKPSHPELLDWLASDFMEHDWKLKRLHKLMMTSRTYLQSSLQHESGDQIDSQNRLLWRMPVRRIESELVRDAILAVSGQLNTEQFGPPIPVETNQSGIFTVGGGKISANKTEYKRSIYIQVRRTKPVAMLEAFDSPQMEPNCERRVVSTVATQSLALLNSHFILQQANAFAKRTINESGQDASLQKKVTRAWKLAYNRDPSETELADAVFYLQEQMKAFEEQKLKTPKITALASLCQVLLCSNEFLYVD